MTSVISIRREDREFRMPIFDRSDEECIAFKNKKLSHYHIVRLNDNHMTTGRVDRNQEFDYLGLRNADLQGRRVLDVGALDGVLSFNAERAGAARVLAIDVEDPRLQDWGWAGAPAPFDGLGQVKRRVFDELGAFFDSAVERRQKTVYDLDPEADGVFDVIFFYGVLYHLRHPLLAFDRLRAVATGAVCVETHVCNHEPMTPSCLFYRDDVLDKADSNWSGPSEACVASWMVDAGFRTVYAETKPRMRSRQRFVGFVDEPTFTVTAPAFRLLDDAYFAEARSEAARKIRLGALWRI
jgi:tRNA (mo5U34)-methyltransferase